MIKIGKEFVWEMSHRLPFHQGLCSNLHGHSYKMLVELEGELDENGMVLDFYNIDKIVSPLLKEFDHSLIVDKNDEKVIAFLKENNFRYKILNTNSTSENLALYFLNHYQNEFAKYNNIKILRIRVYETADAFAEASKQIN